MLHWLFCLVRMVLQLTHNMESALWSGKQYGSSRSLVRKIGSNLPILQSPRVHLQLIPYPVAINGRSLNGAVASFADVGWVVDEEAEASARLRTQNNWHHRLSPEDGITNFDTPIRRQVSMPSLLRVEPPEVKPQPPTNEEALQKINALEGELANLRAQIAKIVTFQEQQSVTAVSSPTTAFYPGGPPLGGPPPPPPPPPPPLPPGLQRSISAIDLINERKGKKTSLDTTVFDSVPKQPEIPNMLDVLKDMNRVKLRSVKSSLSLFSVAVESMAHCWIARTEEPKPSDPFDPATLIAEALKKKFAYRYRSDSYGESDKKSFSNVEEKMVTETPLFGPHMLKSTGKMKSLIESSHS